MSQSSGPRGDSVALVAGDLTADGRLAVIAKDSDEVTATRPMHASWEWGGAELLRRCIEAFGGGSPRLAEAAATTGPSQLDPDSAGEVASFYALCRPFGFDHPRNPHKRVWRIERFVGVDPPKERRDQYESQSHFDEAPSEAANVLALHDLGLGFRDRPNAWPQMDPESLRWIVLRTVPPFAEGKLWEALAPMSDRLVVVVTADELRRSEVRISHTLSWERTAQDVLWELTFNPRINALSRCAYTIVSFGAAGAIVVSSVDQDPNVPSPSRVIYDPTLVEGEWEDRRPGRVSGTTTLLTASVAADLITADSPDIDHSVSRGLAAGRTLRVTGYREEQTPERPSLRFPLKEVVGLSSSRDISEFVVSPIHGYVVPDRYPTNRQGGPETPRFWTILEDRYPEGLGKVAQKVAVQGVKEALRDVPRASFGKLMTIDRQEIEAYRSIRGLIEEYSRQARPRRPLSLAVLGPPGSGKSFGVTEVAQSLLPEKTAVLQFNVSQFTRPEDLHGALHQVRDVSLRRLLPLVFWDEFDTDLAGQRFGWLRHFLSPMQDGSFNEGEIVHPIGPAIFVFAGSTSEKFASFASGSDEAFRMAKGPDFVSRLRGHIDVMGPDPLNGDVTKDPYYVLRRAILLRSILLRDVPALFESVGDVKWLNVDYSVLHAFLHTRQYRHGARSMEAIVAMSRLSGQQGFERSALPADAQLDMHVQAQDFLSLVLRVELAGKVLDDLAEAAHVVFCEAALKEGNLWPESSREWLQKHPVLAPLADASHGGSGEILSSLVPFSELPPSLQEENRELVGDIPNKLAAAGYVMRPATGGYRDWSFSADELEALAKQEHQRWLEHRLRSGWSYGPARDLEQLHHPDMVPWDDMREEERAQIFSPEELLRIGSGCLDEESRRKDRELVEGIPRILAVAGYVAEKIGDAREA